MAYQTAYSAGTGDEDPLWSLLMDSGQSQDYTPLYGKATLGGMLPSRALAPPEIPSINPLALSEAQAQQDVAPGPDPYMMYLNAMYGDYGVDPTRGGPTGY